MNERLAVIVDPRTLDALEITVDELADPDTRAVAIRADHPDLDRALRRGEDVIEMCASRSVGALCEPLLVDRLATTRKLGVAGHHRGRVHGRAQHLVPAAARAAGRRHARHVDLLDREPLLRQPCSDRIGERRMRQAQI